MHVLHSLVSTSRSLPCAQAIVPSTNRNCHAQFVQGISDPLFQAGHTRLSRASHPSDRFEFRTYRMKDELVPSETVSQSNELVLPLSSTVTPGSTSARG